MASGPGPAAPRGAPQQPPIPANDRAIAQLGPEYMQEFREVQAVSNNFFAYHRLGLSFDPRKPWEDPNRPPPGTRPRNNAGGQHFWDGQYSTDPLLALDRQVRQRWLFRDLRRGGKRSSEDANRGARATRRYLRGQGCDVSLLQVLGFGGNGVASLFDVNPGRGRVRKKVVVKASLRSGQSMADERGYNRILKRARYIIQMLDWTRELMDTDGASDEAKDRWEQIDENEELLTLEYMKNGDVWGFLKKVALTGEKIPNKILWKIFFCLLIGDFDNYKHQSVPRFKTMMGKCMHMMITQAGPPYPPAAMGPMNHPAGDGLFTRPTVFTNFWKIAVNPFYTHGYLLVAENTLDQELKGLLMRCLADLPADRPSLAELEAWMWAKEAERDWNDPNDGTREWCDRIFRDAPNL
ncbi:hypothetical protein VMCG_08849 [Cytospora schulzeri]|uniref:Protein kinase domain-containing protein n=1 Tax=Cytospora schulzeri TaxID=448051 RepID=A0A423VUN9_9PEZI|nr:hypothetical protein VMCG_08849 [Valsa malicola]